MHKSKNKNRIKYKGARATDAMSVVDAAKTFEVNTTTTYRWKKTIDVLAEAKDRKPNRCYADTASQKKKNVRFPVLD
ncbi:hypothetical protein PHMEG_00039704 [Phytophthora megakarya]|uniref:Uncharacterized protein n=1 Tax=Phytophthora megakarya TaxID=4795 RepID=A0A225UF11_9STRA|nr:hypothetical protein PHMEG_00039704 [Phytophthora megakarya]